MKTTIRKNIHTINKIIVIIGFFMPWISVCNNYTYSAYELTLNDTELLEDTWPLLASLITPILGLIILYMVNEMAIHIKLFISLILSIIGISPLLYIHININNFYYEFELLIGFWITFIGYLIDILLILHNINEENGFKKIIKQFVQNIKDNYS